VAKRRHGARRTSGLKLSTGAIAGAAFAVAAGGVIYVWGRGENGGPADDVLASVVQVGAGPWAAIQDFGGHIQRSWNAADRVKQLELENQQLRDWRQTAQGLAERLERYEALLNMPADVVGDKVHLSGAVAARLVLDPGGPFKRTLLANAGGDHGVRRGFLAVNEHGLVGRVVSVGGRSARVLLLDDYNSRVPVMGLQSRSRAMMAGDASDSPTLETGKVEITAPRLDYPLGAGGLREGERIVTSGDGGVFPRGLLVGTATLGGDGRWRVRLAAANQAVDFVRLLPFARPDAPEAAPFVDAGPPGPPGIALRSSVTAAPAPPVAPPLSAPLSRALPPAPRIVPRPVEPGAEDVDAPPPVDDPGPPQ
jgi:rod shape-determining protein MreC